MTLWDLGVDPHVPLRGSISSSPWLSFVTACFKDTAETLPKRFICLLTGKLSYFAIFLCSQVCYNCNVIPGTPRHTITAAAGALHPKHTRDQIERLSNTDSSISSGITLTFTLKQFSLQYPTSATAPRCLSLGCRFGSEARFHKMLPVIFYRAWKSWKVSFFFCVKFTLFDLVAWKAKTRSFSSPI